MKIFFLIIVILLCIVSIHANYTIIQQIPNITIPLTTRQLSLQISQAVNRPTFPSFIHIFNLSTNLSINQIDVHIDDGNTTYSNNTLTFNIPQFNINDQFYITFDVGVLFSNISVNSTAQTDPNFWPLKVIDLQTSTTITNTIGYTSIGTTQYISTGTSMTSSSNNNTSAFTATIPHTTANQTTVNVNTTTTTAGIMNTGEPPPTRSAQIGMGLGITFISLLIIIEIIYFKYCHSGNGRSGSYFT